MNTFAFLATFMVVVFKRFSFIPRSYYSYVGSDHYATLIFHYQMVYINCIINNALEISSKDMKNCQNWLLFTAPVNLENITFGDI